MCLRQNFTAVHRIVIDPHFFKFGIIDFWATNSFCYVLDLFCILFHFFDYFIMFLIIIMMTHYIKLVPAFFSLYKTISCRMGVDQVLVRNLSRVFYPGIAVME